MFLNEEGREMNRKIIFATGNEGKMREVRMILGGMNCEVLSMKEAGVAAEPEEDGSTFEENAVIKAKAVAALCSGIVLADDSGLEIDALGKAPGIYSARYLGHDTPYDIKNEKILKMLENVPQEERTARFVCAIAALTPDGRCFTVRETMEGMIGYQAAGENGFGYDPIFYLPEFGCTSAQLSPQQKNSLSHRGKALRAMRKVLEEYFVQ